MTSYDRTEGSPPDARAARPGRRAQHGERAATIYDIARLTGLSASTVSRALNKPGRTKSSTEARVRAAAAEVGYRVNPMARSLLTGRTGTVGLVVSDLTNPVFLTLIRSVQRALSRSGTMLVVAESQESADVERETIEKLKTSTDGLLLVASRLGDDEVRDLACRSPIVLVNRRVVGAPFVVPDGRTGVRDAIAHLEALGHTGIAYLGGHARSWVNQNRWESVFREATARSMSVVQLGPAASSLDGGYGQLHTVLASGFDAVLAYNDLMAIGLMQAAHDDGVSVPGRLSIIGCDDIFGATFTSPRLTTVRAPLDRLGAAAVDMLGAVVDGKTPAEPELLHMEFVPRGSTGSPPPRP